MSQEKELKKKRKVLEAVSWYNSKRDNYKRLALKMELIIKDILEGSNITYHSVTSRAKDVDSFKEKAQKDKYDDPKNQIFDLAAVRITAYVESDVEKICKIIEKEFKLKDEHTINKSESLKINEVGYRSIHYVATLNNNRAQLPEYSKLNAPFEIQIRTILQHAWAEIEHDRNYKFNEVQLPEHGDIKRRFALLAGSLELLDRNFDDLVRDIDSYTKQVVEQTDKGDLNIPIDTISVTEYLDKKLKPVETNLEKDFGPKNSKEIINELEEYGISTLQDLNQLVEKNNLIKRLGEFPLNTNFTGLLRLFMMFENPKKYFDKSWKNDWSYINDDSADFIKKYKPEIKFENLLSEYGIVRRSNL